MGQNSGFASAQIAVRATAKLASELQAAAQLLDERYAEDDMTDDEAKKLMEHYGITATQQPLYHFNGFRYSNLTDALSYAALLTGGASKSGAPQGAEGRTSRPS